MRLHVAGTSLLAMALLATRVEAQPEIDEGKRREAQHLGEEATDDYTRGDYATALDKFQRADALVRWPSLNLRIARCLEKLDRYLEASELYLTVTQMDPGADLRGVQAAAKASAATERAALLPRIPALVLLLPGAADAVVTLDGKPFPAALLGVKRLVDPGAHRIVVARGAGSVERELMVRPGETQTLALDPPPVPPAPSLSPGSPLPARAPPLAPSAEPLPPASPTVRSTRVAAYALGGLGLASLVAGGVTGGLVLSKKGAIDAGCVNKGARFECDAAGKSAFDTATTLGLVSTVTVAAGLAAAVITVVLVATEPRAKPAATGAARPRGGVISAGILGAGPATPSPGAWLFGLTGTL